MLSQDEQHWLASLLSEDAADQNANTQPHTVDDDEDEDEIPIPKSLWISLLEAAESFDEDEEDGHWDAMDGEVDKAPFAVPNGMNGSSSSSQSPAAEQLRSLLSRTYDDEGVRSSIFVSIKDVLSQAVSAASAGGNGEAAAGDLAELVGFEHLELVGSLLEDPAGVLSALDGNVRIREVAASRRWLTDSSSHSTAHIASAGSCCHLRNARLSTLFRPFILRSTTRARPETLHARLASDSPEQRRSAASQSLAASCTARCTCTRTSSTSW
mgnify:CR=1 FL=1